MKTEKILAVIIIISCLAISCQKDEPEPVIEILIEVTDITQKELTVNIQVPSNTQEGGVFFAQHSDPGLNDVQVIRPQQSGVIKISFGSLQPGTEYYFKGYAIVNSEIYYSQVIRATTHANAITKEACPALLDHLI